MRSARAPPRVSPDPRLEQPASLPTARPRSERFRRDTRGAKTIREQLEKHRSDTSCAGCHAKIDTPGFALESFDVIGGFRDRYRSLSAGNMQVPFRPSDLF